MKAFQQDAYLRFCGSGGGVMMSLPGLVSCSFWRRVSGSGGGSGPGGMVAYPTLWTEWLTDASENITFPQLRLRAVTKQWRPSQSLIWDQHARISGVTTTTLLPTLVVFTARVFSLLFKCWNTCFKFVYFFGFRCWTTVIRRGLCVVFAASRFVMNTGFDAMNGVTSCRTKTASTRASTVTRPSPTRGR